MPDEVGTEAARSDAACADESLFGDAADNPTAATAGEQVSTEETEQDGQGPEDAETNDGDGEATRDQEGVTEAGEPDAAAAMDTSEELKVVVSIKEGRATIGVQQPSSDPHIESFDDHDLPGLTQEVPAVVERARARWEGSPKHPAYERPALPVRSRSRRRQGSTQASTAEAGEAQQAQQQTLRLF